MHELQHAHAAPRPDPRLLWVLPFAAAAVVQAFAIQRSGASGPLLDVANTLAYALAVLLCWALAPAGRPAAGGAEAAAEPRWSDWLAGTPALFRSPKFRTLRPGVTAMLVAGLLTGGASAMVVIGQGDGNARQAAGAAALLVGLEVGRFLLVWLVTAFLLCLSAVLVTGETDFRLMAALSGYGYLMLPVAVYLGLAYQFVFFPGTPGNDPRIMVPAALLLKAAEVWAVFAVARGFRWADPRRPVAASRALLVAALPFIVLSAGKLVFRGFFG